MVDRISFIVIVSLIQFGYFSESFCFHSADLGAFKGNDLIKLAMLDEIQNVVHCEHFSNFTLTSSVVFSSGT